MILWKAQTRLSWCGMSACSFADSNKCPKHSWINFTFPLLHLNWFILHAQGKSIFQTIIFIYCMYQEYCNHCKKTRDEKQADVISSEISGPSGYTLISLLLASVMLIPTHSHIPDLSDRLLCDRILWVFCYALC